MVKLMVYIQFKKGLPVGDFAATIISIFGFTELCHITQILELK